MNRLVLAAAALVLAAVVSPCSAQDAALKSVELADLNTKVQPCDNFFDYANGTWRATHPIPASMDRWSRRWQAGEENKEQLRLILDDISAAPAAKPGTPAQLTGDFYAACTNIKAIDAAGVTPLKPTLAAIDAISTPAALQQEIRSLHGIGVPVPFGFGGVPDIHAPRDQVAMIFAGGLGLPDRDYYLKPDKRFADARTGYVAYVEKILTLAGTPAAQAHAQTAAIMQMETALAKASLDNVALRDPHNIDHKTSFDDLKKATPHFDWEAYFRSANLPPQTVNVSEPAFLAEFDRQLAATPLADWKAYLRWQVLNNFADNLSDPFVQAHFAFYQKELAGVGELKPRATRCAEMDDALLGEALGQEYVRRYFPAEAKQRADAMVRNILAAMHGTIDHVDWMTPATRQKALEKLSTFNVKIGYPDKWKDYSSVKITRASFMDDVLAASSFAVADDRSTIGKPVDRGRWSMTPPTSNAYYNAEGNEIVFPAGILQPPAFSLGYTDAVNYGAIGVVIGHEISHGFDDQGSQFDAQGRLESWWTPEDRKKFEAKTGCVVDQFNGFSIDGDPSIHINGKLVLGESIGDLAGLKIAYLAFKKTPQGQSNEKINGFTPDQQFFIAWGQFRGDETRPETQKMMVQGDPHPVAKYRVLGPLSNFPQFATAFACKPTAAMVRSEAERCVVW